MITWWIRCGEHGTIKKKFTLKRVETIHNRMYNGQVEQQHISSIHNLMYNGQVEQYTWKPTFFFLLIAAQTSHIRTYTFHTVFSFNRMVCFYQCFSSASIKCYASIVFLCFYKAFCFNEMFCFCKALYLCFHKVFCL